MSDASESVTVLYTCSRCGIRKREVNVQARGEEDVGAWMHGVLTPALHADHRSASPECRAEALDEVMIPISGADKIGGVVRQ